MSKKIPRNAICPLCSSGLKYKFCCGKNEPLKGTSMRFIGDERQNLSDFEKVVYEKLGHYPDDYIKKINCISEVIYVLVDESNIGDYYSVGGVVVLKSDIEKNKGIYTKLRELVEKYNIDNIHYTDIFGRKKILGSKRKEFIKEYAEIVKGLDMLPFTVCMNKAEIRTLLNLETVTTEQCYMALTWLMMFNILIFLTYKYGTNLIIEMWKESENITVEKRILHQENIRGVIEKFPFAHISFYRHYILFYKEELLFSSLTDFIAYLSIGVYPKIKANVVLKELANNYYDLLNLFNKIFGNTLGMKSAEFDTLLEIVRDREKYKESNLEIQNG